MKTREEATKLAKELFDFFDAEPGMLYIRIEERYNRLVVRCDPDLVLDWKPESFGGMEVIYQ